MKKVKQLFLDFKIQTKLFLTITTLVLLPIVVLSLYFIESSIDIVRENSERYILDTMNQTGKSVDDTVRMIDSVMFNLATSREMQQHIMHLDTSHADGVEYQKTAIQLKSMISETINPTDEIKTVLLVTEQENMVEIKRKVSPFNNSFKEIAYDGKGSTLWLGDTQNPGYITIVKAVIHLTKQTPIGYLVVMVDQNAFLDIIDTVQFTNGKNIFLVNEKKQAIVSPRNEDALIYPELLQKTTESLLRPYGKTSLQADDSSVDMAYKKLNNIDWTLFAVYEDVASRLEIQKIIMTSIFFVILNVFVVLLISWILSKYISTSIKRVKQSFFRFSRGDFETKIPVTSNDEIGELFLAFNEMVVDIGALVERLDEERNAKLKAELKALQMQINPHFLYNTLDTISWMAMLKEASDISEVTRSLALLMRYSIGKENHVLLEQELVAVNSYKAILQYRMPSLRIDLQVEEHLREVRIPKQIILPMLENAVEHGLTPKISDDKHILIACYEREGTVYIKVQDNGIGVSEQRIKEIFDRKNYSYDSYDSIGIINVHNRIRLHYGTKSGVTMRTLPEGGTAVIITLNKEDGAKET